MVEDLCPSHESLAQWFPSPQGAKDTNYDVDTASNKDPLVPGTIAWLESRKRSWRKQRANKRLVDAEDFGLTEPAPFKQTRHISTRFTFVTDVPLLPKPIAWVTSHPQNKTLAWVDDSIMACYRFIMAETGLSQKNVAIAF